MNNIEFSKILTDTTNALAHADNVKDYRARFYKLYQEAKADGVAVEYRVHERSIEDNDKASNLLGDPLTTELEHQPSRMPESPLLNN
jgi:hypothetical protein